MVFLETTELLVPWVPEVLLVSEDGQAFLELQVLEAMMVLGAVMASQVPLVLPELQDSLDPLVLRVKLDPQGPLAQMDLQDKEGNLDHKDMLVLKALLVLLETMAVLAAKVKWVLLAFLELLDSWELGVPLDQLGLMVYPASEVLQVNPARTVPRESREPVVNGEKLVPQESQDLRVKMAKMDPLGNLVQMDFQELLEKGVLLASEDLQGQMASQEKRVLLGNVVAQVLQGPEERLESLDEMEPQEAQD